MDFTPSQDSRGGGGGGGSTLPLFEFAVPIMAKFEVWRELAGPQ